MPCMFYAVLAQAGDREGKMSGMRDRVENFMVLSKDCKDQGLRLGNLSDRGQDLMRLKWSCPLLRAGNSIFNLSKIVLVRVHPIFKTRPAPVSPAAHPPHSRYPPPSIATSSIPSIMHRPAVGAWGCP